jgi:hypothetical protein
MCAIVFGQIKLRYTQKIRWYVLMPLILNVDVSMPLEDQVNVSVPPKLKWMFSIPPQLQVDVSSHLEL